MDAFHTKKGREMYARLPRSDPNTASMLTETVTPDTNIQFAFRDLRTKLEDDGWWERDLLVEAKLLAILGSLAAGAVFTAHDAPALSIMLTSLAFTNAGWIGHDYIHGVDDFSEQMRMLAPVVGGISPTWWSDKHNNHHANTNEMGVDEDIAAGPLLYTYAPDPSKDSPFRRFQHLTFFLPFSLLFALWRVRSVLVTVQSIEDGRPRAKEELYSLMTHYFMVLTFLPAHVWVPAIFISGLMSAIIVTPTHQSDVFFDEKQDDWVTAQFRSTRNAVMTNPFSTWLWGGMQYQLEHHLFPSMPRSRYPQLRTILQNFAAENDVTYLESGEFEILKMNWELYRDVAEADVVIGAPTMTYTSAEEKCAAV
jgi:fatty acid desaturase